MPTAGSHLFGDDGVQGWPAGNSGQRRPQDVLRTPNRPAVHRRVAVPHPPEILGQVGLDNAPLDFAVDPFGKSRGSFFRAGSRRLVAAARRAPVSAKKGSTTGRSGSGNGGSVVRPGRWTWAPAARLQNAPLPVRHMLSLILLFGRRVLWPLIRACRKFPCFTVNGGEKPGQRAATAPTLMPPAAGPPRRCQGRVLHRRSHFGPFPDCYCIIP